MPAINVCGNIHLAMFFFTALFLSGASNNLMTFKAIFFFVCHTPPFIFML